MDRHETEAPPGGLQLGDIYYTLFRHKWKIVICALLGLVAAGALYKLQPPMFESQARLLVRYVLETKSFGPTSGDYQRPDSQGEGILDAEVQILTSSDIAQEVVRDLTPEKILGNTSGAPASAGAAAGAILRKDRLTVNAPKRGNVIFVSYQHPDPDMARSVLSKLIDVYLRKHAEIHRSLGEMDEFLQRKTDELKGSLTRTDEELKAEKAKAHIVSIEDTKKAHLELMSRLRADLYDAEAQLAENLAALPKLTNDLANAKQEQTIPVISPPTEEKLNDYRRVVGQVEYFQKREQELLTQFTGENALLQAIRRSLANALSEKSQMERDEPGLLKEAAASKAAGNSNTAGPDVLKIPGIQAKIAVLQRQLQEVRREASAVEEVENKVRDLTRRKEVLEAQYKYYSTGLEQARLDEALGSSKLTNIKLIQSPTASGKNFSKLFKKMGTAAGGGLAFGIALAFFFEIFLDQSVRRPSDLQKKLRIPVFINIPQMEKSDRKNGALKGANGKKLLSTSAEPENPERAVVLQGNPTVNLMLQTYCDALRDRLISYFQRHNMTHKPKLVAITGCSNGAGISTIAAGLAAALSETGDGNVLLVDTNVAEGAAHPFCRGKLSCGLNDALKEDRRGEAQVQDNLYVATANEADGSLIKALPKKFGQLVPKLKASDYDYIIFDMPPVSQISITSKLAGFMDMVLLVVESEKTSRAIVSEASSLLRESNANVATVINKTRRYVPRWVHREFE